MTMRAKWSSMMGVVFGTVLGLAGCDEESGPARVTVTMKADYGTAGKAGGNWATTRRALFEEKLEECPAETVNQDSPQYVAGLDCDGDGGIISYLTPQEFKVAIKSLRFLHEDGQWVTVVPEAGRLVDSVVVDLTQPQTLFSEDVPGGSYTDYEVKLYYYEMKLLVGDPPVLQNMRIYLSDDDFPAEGSLGHHQGDIVFLDEQGNELGFVAPAQPWTVDGLQADRGDIMGAGGTDSETGHRRGLYGGPGLWDQDLFRQGPDQDVYVLRGPLNLRISGSDREVVFTFQLANLWYFEDFDDNGAFSPCQDSIEACDPDATWSPLFGPPQADIQ